MKISLTGGSDEGDLVTATAHGHPALHTSLSLRKEVYVTNYENLVDVKESTTAALLELTNKMILTLLKKMEKRLKMEVERRGLRVEN